MPDFLGVHHIALSVTDVSVSVPFYRRLFGQDPVAVLTGATFVRHVFRPLSTMSVGLTQHDPHFAGPFDPTRPGLDHVGFGCADRAALDAWAAHLEAVGIAFEPIVVGETGLSLNFKDPDNIALEFYVSSDAAGV